jgi:hypothetical protein
MDYIDHHKWLISNNMLTDHIKDTIAMAGYCLLEEVKDVSTSIDFNNKKVTYKLLLPKKLYDNMMLLDRFNKGKKISFLESFRLRRFVKSKNKNDETNFGYNLEEVANKFIKNYLTKEWSTEVSLFKENSDEAKNFWLRGDGDRSLN